MPARAAEDFAGWWREAGPDPGDATLEAHVRAAHGALVAPEPDVNALGFALDRLLVYLAGEGRGRAAYGTVDAFFCLLTAEHVRLVDRLPSGWQELVDDLGLELASALDDPDRAEIEGTSAKRLLDRLHGLVRGRSADGGAV